MPSFASEPRHLMGWVDHPGRHALTATLPRFGDAGRPLMLQPIKDVFLYKAWNDVLGHEPAYPAQQIGDCTSFGSGHAVDLCQCVEIALDREPFRYEEVCTEAIYGMGREIAHMLGQADGCYGAAVAQAVMEGVVPRAAVGPYSGTRAKQWGTTGVPAAVKQAAGQHKIKATALVATTEELDAALGNGYPVIVCSTQGFSMHRDQGGGCQAEGSWPHCMHINGARRLPPDREYCVGQSWGANVPDGPRTDDQPSFSFWAHGSVVARMLALRDSFAFSHFDGFPGRPLPASWSYKQFV